MSLTEHSALIEQLKPLMLEPNFPQVFEQLTAGESNSTRFLLKMELNRLGAECTRLIDLRDKSELPCEELRVGRQTHFLDEPAKQIFQQTIALYQGKYTLGVYEAVMNAHRKRRQKSQDNPSAVSPAESQPFTVPGIVLGNYFSRTEERMNYSMKILVSQPGRGELPGITADLSVGGARIRLPSRHPFSLDIPLKVKLVELSQEFYYEDLQQGVDYQIVSAEGNGEFTWMRLKRLGGSEGLSEMLANLIRGYKFRYKVDINDVLVTATGLGFERHYLPHLPHLPLFLDCRGDKPRLSHLLLSPDNQAIVHYFQDENDVSQLEGMLTPGRLAMALRYVDDADHRTFFCFTHNANGKLFFYSATLAELKHRKERELFFGFGAGKPSWRVFKLTMDTIDHGKRYKSSVIPGDAENYSALTEQQLASFSHVMQLMDLTHEPARLQYQGWYNNGNANALKVYGQKKAPQSSIKQVSLEFSERRREARFAFKTLVEIQQGGVKVQGLSNDISSRGLQVVLDNASAFEEGKPVTLSLPKLQAIAGKSRLTGLPYRLVKSRKDGMVLHLTAIIGHEVHAGVEFLNKLIVHNREKLTQLSENNSDIKELSDGLKNLVMRKLYGVPFFIEKTAKTQVVSFLGTSVQGHDITDMFAALSSEPQHYNLAPLLGNGMLKQAVLDPIRTLRPNDEMSYVELFVQVIRQSRGGILLKFVPSVELGAAEAQLSFINQSNQVGKFMAIRLYRGATGKPDNSCIRRELEYIHVHAQHKAKQLEEQLWRIVGVGELLDVTDEVVLRFQALAQ
ncbi:PilZ domain-containing protein [Shewanella litorisediminis]|uniref:PilZ domain-containing protein n=1 Tax=Shewanella litorisediminis TaxID=1173586 RepID=A0ABX7G695_9GAMM|nr:PilZ domain-containing protein [Shewanella litorisediminis]MCL2917597.1 PilZ domain-containing protein [Shewanella litorisediminis]QRH02723.1 PilZ domain-containing protein [Shewanella litorisediminis]